MDFVNKYAERVSRVIDEQTLANVEHQLDEYDYVKVVRCRDCRLQDEFKYCDRLGFKVGDNGYCAWPKRREDG